MRDQGSTGPFGAATRWLGVSARYLNAADFGAGGSCRAKAFLTLVSGVAGDPPAAA